MIHGSSAPLSSLPHHDGSPLYVSHEAPAIGDLVRVRMRVPAGFPAIEKVRVRSNPDREQRWFVASLIGTADGWDWWEAELSLENEETRYRFLLMLADGTTRWLNAAGFFELETLDSEDFSIVTYAPPPAWGSSTVMYQIFPDRFGRSSAADGRELPAWALPAEWNDEVIHVGPDTPHQFFGGDLAGIGEHLDHLERLGVTMIYLTPIFPARSNHRYDALSFAEVDELLGGDEDFIALIEAAHQRGFTVIGDLTANHSGDAHEWFQASHLTPDAPESEFYYWLDDEQRDYAAWLGVPSLPKFNWNSAELRRRFIEGPDSVVARWLAPPYSLDGWRIDVANMTGRYLTDDLNQDVRRIIRQTMIETNPNTILLGEFTNDATLDFQGDGWHGAMTYANFTRPVWAWLSEPGSPSSYFGLPFGTIPTYTGGQVLEAHQRFAHGFPWRVRQHNMNALDSHDTPRFATNAIEGAIPVAFGLSVALPGIPTIFAGDELGFHGDDGEHSRTPMPWATLERYDDTIESYAALIRLRREHPALSEGGLRWLHAGDDVLVFVREAAEESVLIVAARAAYSVDLEPGAVAGAPVRVFGSGVAEPGGSGVRLHGSGPSFTAFVLPGVTVPRNATPDEALADTR